MKKQKGRNSILWVEAAGFSFIIGMIWLAELFKLPHYFFHEPPVVSWHRAALRSIVIIVIWAWVYFITRRLLQRLHYLEEFLRICSWCRKVCHENQWLRLEDYFNSKFATRTSHAMCPECLEKNMQELAGNENMAQPESRFK